MKRILIAVAGIVLFSSPAHAYLKSPYPKKDTSPSNNWTWMGHGWVGVDRSRK